MGLFYDGVGVSQRERADMSSELLCKNCKHSFREFSSIPYWGSGAEWRCRKAFVPETIEHDPVVGPKKESAYYKRCSLVRLHNAEYKNECGKEGTWWEPKSKKFFFLDIKHSDRSTA